MRGIAGVIRLSPSAADPATAFADLVSTFPVAAAGAVTRSLVTADACLARIATAVVPEDRLDTQPLRLPDGALLATTARLRNRAALAAEFGWAPAALTSKADSEFVASAYARWGEDCPRHLDGPFALVVWQPVARRLFCATDRVASSPIYYTRTPRGFAFASTLNALLSLPGQTRRLDRAAFAAVVANVPADDEATLYEGISRLRGAHALSVDAAGLRTWRCRENEPPPLLELPSDADYVAAMREQLTAALRRSLRPMPGQVGLLLSGGLDSSAVAAIAGRLLADEGRRLQCIHILPRGTDRYRYSHTDLDETRYVRALQAFAPHLDFHFVETTSQPAPRAAWDDYFAENRAPFDSLLATETGLDSHLDRLDARLLLDGLGGNHVVSLEALPSGYLSHLALTGCWLKWWHETRAHARLHGRSWRALVRHTAINPWKHRLRGRAHASVFRESPLTFLHPEIRRQTGIDDRKRAFHERWFGPPLDLRRRLTATVHEWAALTIAPRPSVCSAAPMRRVSEQPLYDRQLNAFCLSLPFAQQVRDGCDRRLLREAMRGLLPEEIRQRVTRGLLQPEFQTNFTRAEPMLREELARLGSSALERELLDCERLRQLWPARDRAPSFRHEAQLVKALVTAAFLRWHERHGGE